MSVGSPKLSVSTGYTSVSNVVPKYSKSDVENPLAGLAVSLTTIARFEIATTRPVLILAFAQADEELALRFIRSPTCGTATDRLKRPAFSCLALRARGISGVSSTSDRSLTAASNASSFLSGLGPAGGISCRLGSVIRFELAARVVLPVKIESRSSDPLKSE